MSKDWGLVELKQVYRVTVSTVITVVQHAHANGMSACLMIIIRTYIRIDHIIGLLASLAITNQINPLTVE